MVLQHCTILNSYCNFNLTMHDSIVEEKDNYRQRCSQALKDIRDLETVIENENITIQDLRNVLSTYDQTEYNRLSRNILDKSLKIKNILFQQTILLLETTVAEVPENNIRDLCITIETIKDMEKDDLDKYRKDLETLVKKSDKHSRKGNREALVSVCFVCVVLLVLFVLFICSVLTKKY